MHPLFLGVNEILLPGWWPNFLRWPFPPGFFIAILGFLAAFVTFLKEPSKVQRAFWVAIFFGLMCGEILMLGKDRDAHSKAEQDARDAQNQQSDFIRSLTLQFTQEQATQVELSRRIDAAKGNPQLIASLQAQAALARTQANSAYRQILLATVPGISAQIINVSRKWYKEDDDFITRSYAPIRAAGDAAEGTRLSRAVDTNRANLAHQTLEEMKPLLTSADFLRHQLLEQLNAPEQTQEDKKQALVFTKVIAGERITPEELAASAYYLSSLAEKVRALDGTAAGNQPQQQSR